MDDIGGTSPEPAASLVAAAAARLLRRKKRAARAMSASPPTPPTTPPTIAPVSLEPLAAAPDTLVALGVPVDDDAAEVDVELARLVELQCVNVSLFEDVWFSVTWFLKLVLHLSVRSFAGESW